MKRKLVLTLCTAIISLACAFPAFAAPAYPDTQINLVVPFPPGGGSDRLSRLIDGYMEKHFGTTMTFMYKPGGGSMIGTQYMATMPKDGYWIGTVNTPQIYGLFDKGAPFTMDSFDFIAQMSSEPMVLAAPPGSELNSLQDFITMCKEKGTKVSVGIPSGTSGTVWFASEGLKRKAGITYTPVPMKGGNDLNASLLGKHIDAGLGNLGPILPESKKMKILAISGEERSPLMPDVPTFKESGVEVLDIARRLYIAPKGMPAERLQKLADAFKSIAADKEFQALMAKNGFSVTWAGGEDLKKALYRELEEIRNMPK